MKIGIIIVAVLYAFSAPAFGADKPAKNWVGTWAARLWRAR